MYTKEEKYYSIVFRKSLKSYRKNNYRGLGIEFKTYEAAQDFLANHMDYIKSTPMFNDFKEAIIVEFTNKPINSIRI